MPASRSPCLYLTIVARVLVKLLDEENTFAILASAGLVIEFGLQALINMAVNVQIAPSKGMTLPFISYGGSSMLALSIGMGLLLAFTRRNPYLTRSPYVVKWSGEQPPMNFVLAAGGTGGHMVPAHALAAELKKRGHGVLLITDDRGARFPGLFEGVPVHILPAGRLGGGADRAGPRRAARCSPGRREAKNLYQGASPRRGRSASAAIRPCLRCSRRRRCKGIPTVLHEQNAVLGRANRFLAGDAAAIATAYSRGRAGEAQQSQRRSCSSAIRSGRRSPGSAKTRFPPFDEYAPFKILVTGGSQGATVLSKVVPEGLGTALALASAAAAGHAAVPAGRHRRRSARAMPNSAFRRS